MKTTPCKRNNGQYGNEDSTPCKRNNGLYGSEDYSL